MTDSHQRVDDTEQPSQQPEKGPGTKHVVVVPNSINMVSLLGPGDEHLALIERAFQRRRPRPRQPDHAHR